MTGKIKALERVWAAEVENRLPFQSKAKIFRQLCEEGLIEPMTRDFGKDCFGPIAVSGYQLTETSVGNHVSRLGAP